MATLTRDLARREAARRQTPRRNWLRLSNPYLYLIPAMLIMTVMTYYPMAYGLWMSTTDFSLKNLRVGSDPPNFLGLQNFIDILTGSVAIPHFDFFYTLFFNLWWTFSNVSFHVVVGVLIAVLLNARGLW